MAWLRDVHLAALPARWARPGPEGREGEGKGAPEEWAPMGGDPPTGPYVIYITVCINGSSRPVASLSKVVPWLSVTFPLQ